MKSYPKPGLQSLSRKHSFRKTIEEFKLGREASILIFENLNLISGIYTSKGCQTLNQKRLSASKYKNLDSSKECQKIRRGKSKQKDNKKEGNNGKCMKLVCYNL